jgi:hypothetical protein
MPQVRRKTQYKRNPKLKRDFPKYLQATSEHVKRWEAWMSVLKDNPSEHAINKIADLLARLGFEPDEYGRPHGDWPPIARINPLVLLDGLHESVETRDGMIVRQDTLAWKTDCLEAATLIWAGAIDSEEQIQEACPLASMGVVFELLTYSDLEAYWNRRGVGLTAADIREKWKRGERIVTNESLAGALKHAKGGT